MPSIMSMLTFTLMKTTRNCAMIELFIYLVSHHVVVHCVVHFSVEKEVDSLMEELLKTVSSP